MRIGWKPATALAVAIAALSSAPSASAAVVPTFNPSLGALSVVGDAADNEIVISRDQLGVIAVNGQVPLTGGPPSEFPTVFNVKTISVFGVSGDDSLRMEETNGPLPGAQMFGGSGDDVVSGGSGADALHGQDGNDRLGGGRGDDFVLGQGGNDVLGGGDGVDSVFGGVGDDVADGDRGDDRLFLGDGNDLAVWDPGDASDELDGEGGFDTFEFRGSGADEQFQASSDGARARLTRNVGAVTIDAGTVERVDVEALGGKDTLTLGDLTGTGVQEFRPDLEAVRGGGVADSETDRLILAGTNQADIVSVLGQQPGSLFVLGLPTFVAVQRADARDALTVSTLAGDDRVEAGTVASGGISQFLVDGGAGDDTLFGGTSADTLIGGDGNDFVDGSRGNDIARLGPGDDTYLIESGDGNDQVEGQAGRDGVHLSGSSSGEQFRASALGARALVERTAGGLTETLDGGGLESLRLVSFGGADTVTVDDLAGTGVTSVDASLFDFSVPGGQAEAVIVNGTEGPDRIAAGDADGAVEIAGLGARIRVTGAEAAGDRLEVRASGGDDVVDSTRLSPSRMRFRGDGGPGDDILRAGAGDDVLDGGTGFDILSGGAGVDVLLNGERVRDD